MLNAYMPEETEYFLADGILEAIGEGHSDDHRSHTDNSCRSSQTNDETGKRPLLIKRDPACNKT